MIEPGDTVDREGGGIPTIVNTRKSIRKRLLEAATEAEKAAIKKANDAKSDSERLESLMERLFGQGVTLPTGNKDAAVIPVLSSTQSILPYLVIAGGIGVILWWRTKTKGDN